MDDKNKEVDHNRRRGKFLRHGLQQVMYMKRFFDLSMADLYELILREDNVSRGFPDYTRDEVYDAMINNRDSPKKLIRGGGPTTSRGPYNRRAEVIAELSSAIITGIESAETDILQARAVSTRAVTREPGVPPEESCGKLCHQRIRKRVRTLELHTGLKQKSPKEKKKNDVRVRWTCSACTFNSTGGRSAPTATNCPYYPDDDPSDNGVTEEETEPRENPDIQGPGGPEDGEGSVDGGSDEGSETRRGVL